MLQISWGKQGSIGWYSSQPAVNWSCFCAVAVVSPRPNSRQDYWIWRNESGGWFQRRGDAYLNERSVILKEEMVGGRERVATDEERVLRGGWTCAAPSVRTARQLPYHFWVRRFSINKCIGDDTKAAARRSPKCIIETKNTLCGTLTSVPLSKFPIKTASWCKISLKSGNGQRSYGWPKKTIFNMASVRHL